MVKILIADDHPLFREALSGALEPFFEGAEVIESDNLESTLSMLEMHSDINLVLLDLNMPGCENYYGLIRVTEDFPEVPVVVISASDSAHTISQTIGLGAKAFISKASVVATISDAIQTVLDGGTWVPLDLKDKIDSISQEQRDSANKVALLTPKQFQVLKFLQAGQLNKQIAYELGVTEATIKAHISAIFKKLEVNTRTQAVLLVEKLQHQM
ncbi:response regulator transcription factor [Aliiglaciecola sp. LCG003]|uniref:response regulator transcription factor n=1 Tax=Aliiglaciecola sp. LCG003 TaxID=3053655 RepID=UPI0025730672|nr:response regulator transcription factor [Aliiglaciecola sp. LCG003]WJG11133.1 response regulator transcription factor [Aliiglaciecola sp. LCG003]